MTDAARDDYGGVFHYRPRYGNNLCSANGEILRLAALRGDLWRNACLREKKKSQREQTAAPDPAVL